MKKDTKEFYAYLAGLIDGEGSIFICKQRRWKSGGCGYQLRLTVGMTHKETIKFLNDNLDGGWSSFVRNNNPKHTKELFIWRICDDGAKELLRKIKDYMITKKKEAEIGIEFREKCFPKKKTRKYLNEVLTPLREEYYLKMNQTSRSKNKRWVSVVKKESDKKSLYGYNI